MISANKAIVSYPNDSFQFIN